MSVLLNDEAELRNGWKVLVWLGVFLALLIGTSAALSLLLGGRAPQGRVEALGLNTVTVFVPALGALLFMLRFVDRAPLGASGVALHARWRRELGLGLALAAAMLAVYLLVQAFSAGLAVRPGGLDEGFWTRWALLVLILAVAAAGEELIYRGYPFQALMAGIGTGPAILIVSALFGLGHSLNPNATPLGAFNTSMAGVLLSLAYVRTRSLWLPYGIHVGWNLGLGVVLGLPVSGLRMDSLWTTEAGGPAWLGGGPFGPEGGVVVTGAMAAAALWVARTKHLAVN